jgi:CHAD domain-containing protein
VGTRDLMTADTSTIEREVKFDVDRDFDPPDLRKLAGGTERLPEERLRTVYFDTPDRRLGERGISLRHRTVERRDDADPERVWTLKLPESPAADFVTRSELSWPGDVGSIPPEALGILRGILRRSQPQQVTQLDTIRRRLLLGGSRYAEPWAELDDDLVTVVGGPRDGTEFRQIEVELTGQQSANAASVIDSLRTSGAQPSGSSKIEIALGRPARGPKLGSHKKRRRREGVAETIKASIADSFGKLLDHEYRLRIDPERPDPHDIHQARVATRRLRSDLKTFSAYLDPVWLDHTREELRWLGNALGRVRDVDVLTKNLADAGATSLHTYEGTAELIGLLLLQRADHVAELREAVDSDRYLDLLDRLHAAQERPPVPSGSLTSIKAAKVLPSLLDKRWRSVRRNIRKGGAHPDEGSLHKVRIRAKRLRYAAETSAPVIGRSARKIAGAAESLQDTLGELRDSQAAEEWLVDMVKQDRLSPAGTFAAGVIARDHELRQERLRRQWESEWKAIKRNRPSAK